MAFGSIESEDAVAVRALFLDVVPTLLLLDIEGIFRKHGKRRAVEIRTFAFLLFNVVTLRWESGWVGQSCKDSVLSVFGEIALMRFEVKYFRVQLLSIGIDASTD